MIIEKVKLENFRNYTSCELKLSPGLNIFKGNNAQGKTNFLESVYISSIGKSPKTNKEKDILSDILYNLQENTSQRGINENIGNIVVNIINFLNLKGISVDEVLTEIDKKEKRIINGSDGQHIKYLLNKKNTIKEKKLDKIKFCICLGNITDFELNNFKA